MSGPSTTTSTKSRRALLAGALGGLGAWAFSAVGRPASAGAANGDPLILGSANNSASDYTKVFNSQRPGCYALLAAAGSYGIAGSNDVANLPGVSGTTTVPSGVAIRGHLSGTGLTSAIAVQGQTAGHWSQIAVDGNATLGVGEGIAVRGRTHNGIGIYAEATGGIALHAAGRTRFTTSGVATIAAGSKTKTVTPGVDVTSSSFVLLTPKANIGSRGLWFTLNATDNKFTIRMSSTRSSNTPVAWLLLG